MTERAPDTQKGGEKTSESANDKVIPIPQPPESLLLGNLLEIDADHSIRSLERLAKIYGEIYQLRLREIAAFVSSQRLTHFLSNEEKFEKVLSSSLVQVRNFAGDGLFTSHSGEHNWTLAHRILIPAFGPLAIKKMQPMMLDIITQMLMFWEHHAGEPFEAADQYTRLTFDTIGYCAFKSRFNSFHSEKLHPFIDIMVKLLVESGHRSMRPGVLQSLMWQKEHEYQQDIAELHRQCDEIVAQRRKNPDPEAKDLLNNMILDCDPKTGEYLSDENIRYQMVTFLIAGHETTSGMLSFATYYMLKNPRTFSKAREEADKAIAEAGGNLLKINPSSLKYIDAICKEALRLQPTAPGWTVTPKAKEGETLPGGYHLPHGVATTILLAALHRDPAAWGDDALLFKPERWLDGREILPDSWKPFGNGSRACIGRGFALQEAHLALALIVARFDLEMADPSYDLEIRQTLTIKPDHFKIVAHPRFGRNQSILSELIAAGETGKNGVSHETDKTAADNSGGSGEKINVLYGSNSGSCEGLAKEIASEGTAKGFNMTLGELDSVAGGGKLPTDAPVIICTASYEGQPTDNARMFVGALETTKDKDSLKGVKYMVMGAGHHDWAQTFHKIPKYIDTRLEELGAERIMPLSLADAGGDIVGDFEEFKEKVWKHFGASSAGGEAVPSTSAPADDGDNEEAFNLLPGSANIASSIIGVGVTTTGTVTAHEKLTEATEHSPQTNSITIKMPHEVSYSAGDYLAVLPKNPQETVDRVLEYFKLDANDTVKFNKPTSFFPVKVPLRLGDVLSSFVELGQPVSKTVLPQIAAHSDQASKDKIEQLKTNYTEEVLNKRLSLFDILLMIDGCKPPINVFLANLPKMKIRQYSISSTPLASPDEVSLTYTVHTASSASGNKALGVASNYLAFLNKDDELLCNIKASSGFHLPVSPSTPVVMFAAGSGVAPFFGFIGERAMQKKAGRPTGPTVLYFGTRTPEDILKPEQFKKWIDEGVLDFRPVLSRSDVTSLPNLPGVELLPGTKYVQDRVWEERKSIEELFDQGAQFYTCGSGARLGASIKKTLVDIIADEMSLKSREEAEELMEKLAKERYRTDVFL